MDFFIALLQRPVIAKPYQRRQPSHDYLALSALYYSTTLLIMEKEWLWTPFSNECCKLSFKQQLLTFWARTRSMGVVLLEAKHTHIKHIPGNRMVVIARHKEYIYANRQWFYKTTTSHRGCWL